jgi:hypothetical protein
MAGRALSFAALIPLVLGFSDTQPIVTWSSHRYLFRKNVPNTLVELIHRSNILDLLPSKLATSAHAVSLLESILHHDDICDYDAVVLVEQPGVSANQTQLVQPGFDMVLRSYTHPTSEH